MSKLKNTILALILVPAWGGGFKAEAMSNVVNFSTASNASPGLVNLSWNYQDTLPLGATVYIQYSTEAAPSWNYNNAQIVLSTMGPIISGSLGSSTASVNVGWNGAVKFPASGYYFRIWVATSLPSGISLGISSVLASVNVPPATVLTSSSPAGAALVSFSGNMGVSKPALDPDGNLYVVTSTGTGVRLAKFSPFKALLWERFYNNPSSVSAVAVAADASAVCMAGHETDPNPAEVDNIFLRKYDAAGNLMWHKVYHNPGSDQAGDAVMDNSGNVYVTGDIYNGSSNDIWLGKYDANGNLLWSKTYTGAGNGDDYGYAVAVDKSNNVIVAGSEYGSDLTQGSNIWVMKYKENGADFWAKPLTYNSPASYSNDTAYGVAVDNSGNIVVAGSEDRYDLSQGNNIWVGKYDANGNPLWTQSYNGPANGDDRGYGAATDNFGNTYVSGQVYDYAEIAGMWMPDVNLWVGKYGPDGKLVNSRMFNSNGSDMDAGYGVRVSSAGTVNVIGQLGSSVGVYYYDHGPVSSLLSAYPGSYAASAGLSWNYTADLPAGSSYYVQISLSPGVTWSTAAAGNIVVSTQAANGSFQNHTVGGLQTSRDAYGNIISPEYYFKVWTSTNGIDFQPVGGISTSTAKTPYLSDANATLPDGSLNALSEGWSTGAPIARDASGNVYLAFGGSLNSDAGFAIRKYDAFGKVEWTRFYNSTTTTNAVYQINALALNGGDMYVCGKEFRLPSEGYNVFAAKITAANNIDWVNTHNGTANGYDEANGMKIDGSGNVYVAGTETNTGTGKDVFVRKYNSAGTPQWKGSFNGSNGMDDEGFDPGFDSAGNIYVAGSVQQSGQGANILLAKFDSNGVFQSSYTYNGAQNSDDQAYGIAIDTGNFIYVAGSSSETIVGANGWLRKYNAALTPVWTDNFPPRSGIGSAKAFGLALDSSGGVYITGYEDETVLNQGSNLWVRKYSAAGDNVWTKTYNNNLASEYGKKIIVDNSGLVHVTLLINAGNDGNIGYYRFSQPAFDILAKPGVSPASVDVYWTMADYLPPGSTCYIQYSTYTSVNWSAAAAQVVKYSSQPAMTGSFQSYTVSSLDAGRDGAGNSISPLYYFKGWHETVGSTTPIAGTASSYANTPSVRDNTATYPDSKVFTINGAYGWRNKIARDANGNLYTVANWSGMGEKAVTNTPMPTMSGASAIVLRKYNPDMSAQWTKFFGGAANENPEGRGLALDGSGNIYVSGTKGSGDSPTKQDILIIKYDPAGNRLWHRAYDYAKDNDSGWSIAAGTAGVVYVTGSVRKTSTDSDIFIGKIPSSDGLGISSITINGTSGFNDEGGDIVFDSTAGVIYAAGSVDNTGSGVDIWLGKYNVNLGLISSATINGDSNGWEAGYGVAADGLGNAYVAGSINTMTQGNDLLVAKYNSSLTLVWRRTYNDPGNNYDTAYGVRTDAMGGVYVAGTESRWDIGQGENLFIRKYNDTGDTIWTRTFNASGSSYESGFDVLVDSSGVVYVGGSFNNGYGIYRYRQLTFSNTNPMLTVFVSSVSALSVSTPMAGAGIVIIPFDQTGGVNPQLVSTGTTDSNGRYAARLSAGFQYFIGISTPGYKPTIKDQMMDPYGSFMLNLTVDTTKQYRLYPRSAAETAYTLNIDISSGLAAGDYAMAEVFYAKTGEEAAYGIGKSTALNTSFPIHNVPPAAAGVYGVNINIPGKNKAMTVYMDRAFPSTSTYTVDMSSALSMVGFDTAASTVPPSFQAVVRSTQSAPLEGVRVEISQSSWVPTGCGGSGCWQKWKSYENMTDVNGMVSFYNLPISTGDIEIRKQGYRNARDYYSTAYNATVWRNYSLQLATYTLTGILKYNGIPLPNARVMAWGDWNWYSGADSYKGNNGMQSDAKANTASDGSFAIAGLTDGNVRLGAEFMGVWRELNKGNNQDLDSDNVRVVISSDAAGKPTSPAGNQCVPGRVWVLDNSGACKSAGSVIFNMIPANANAAGALYGNLAFVTTYTVTSASPLEIPASSPVVVMVIEDSDDNSKKLGFAAVSGVFTTNVAAYSVTLSTGADYWAKIYSPEWGQASSFNDQVNMFSTNTARMDFTLTKAGVLKGVLKFPDGTNFKSKYPNKNLGENDNSPNVYWADIEADGQNVQVYQGTGLDEYGAFEFPNLAPGKYTVKVEPNGGGFRWPPAELGEVVVAVGKTTEVKLRLEDGLVVQPQIVGLPELSTAAWRYKIIGVPSGFQMSQRNISELFFDQPKYTFDYNNTVAGGWDKKYLPPGQYDFYLLIGVKYNIDDPDSPVSYYQFANFIGRAKNVAVQKSDSSPGLGSLEQPIPVNILGSVGQGGIGGRVKGSKIFTSQDYERIFANFESEIGPLIPVVMLYDTAGDLRGFGHAMPDENAILPFLVGVITKNKDAVIGAMTANPLRYLIWGVPPGRYTAVFANPNYPPVTKEIEVQAGETYNFDFDAQNIAVGAITGVVRSSATGSALENVTVYLKHRTVEKFAVTDSSGAFSFANLPSGIYRLEATLDGFIKAGSKTSLGGSDSAGFKFYLLPSVSRITGKIYLSKFPSLSTKAGIKLVAYDETMNVEAPGAYLPKLEANTDESGGYELTGIVPGHAYKISAFYEGKTPQTLDINAVEGDTAIGDIVLADIPPQITVKVRKSPTASKVDVVIKSPKQLVTTPVCKYSPGEVFDSTAAVSLALVPGPDNTYEGQFTVSSNRQYYTLYVAAGDGDNRMEKSLLYDKNNEARTEQYIQDEAIAGGEISMDAEKEEYSGIELDAGALTTSSGTADYSNLVGGFFSALPNVRTVKTAKGNLTIESAVKDLMASEVYNLDLSNAQANKPFTLTLKYDKEKTVNTGNLRIYQYDEASGQWKEIPGNYTVDPMTGVVSVDVASLESAYEGVSSANTPLGRKRFKMSAVVNGRYVPSATGTSQTGKFAVFTAMPGTGVPYTGLSYEVYNMPNPFNLKDKNVIVSADGSGVGLTPGARPTRGTLIKYHLPAGKSGHVKFVIYNLAGEKVRTLDETDRAGGATYYSEWDGKNDTNQDCASGVYFMLTYLNGDKLGNKAHKMAIIK